MKFLSSQLGMLRSAPVMSLTVVRRLALIVWIALVAGGRHARGHPVSSASVYFFPYAMDMDTMLERRYPARTARLKTLLQRHELPVIIGWSFFPLVPTDLIVYVCGVMKIDLKKCLVGILVGAGGICALYIFGADAALRFLQLR